MVGFLLCWFGSDEGWMNVLPSAPVLDIRPLPADADDASSLPEVDDDACALESSEAGPSVKVALMCQ